jgi:hypothetical protein
MKDVNFSALMLDLKKKGMSSKFITGEREVSPKKSLSKNRLFTSLAEEDLEKYRRIIDDPEALISIDDPLGISRNLCMLCKLDCKR